MGNWYDIKIFHLMSKNNVNKSIISDSNCDSAVINIGINKGILPECKGTNLGLSVMLPDPTVLSQKKLKTHLEKLRCSVPCELDEFYPE